MIYLGQQFISKGNEYTDRGGNCVKIVLSPFWKSILIRERANYFSFRVEITSAGRREYIFFCWNRLIFR